MTWYSLGGAGDGAVQTTSTAMSPVCMADKPVTLPPPVIIRFVYACYLNTNHARMHGFPVTNLL